MAIHLELNERLEQIIKNALASGRYRDANEVVGTALFRLIQEDENEQKQIALHKALQEGIDSGFSEKDPFDELLAELRRPEAEVA